MILRINISTCNNVSASNHPISHLSDTFRLVQLPPLIFFASTYILTQNFHFIFLPRRMVKISGKVVKLYLFKPLSPKKPPPFFRYNNYNERREGKLTNFLNIFFRLLNNRTLCIFLSAPSNTNRHP